MLVIGGLHGNEPVPPAVRGLVQAAIAPDVEVWLVPVANPDGSAAGLRCNAHGVDLNRNFPWEWRPSDGGPAPLSEPETQALVRGCSWACRPIRCHPTRRRRELEAVVVALGER